MPLFFNSFKLNISLLLSTTSLFFSCSHYSFKTNLDKEPIEEYFAVGAVEIYVESDIAQLNYQYIDTVEGSSCQQKQNQAPANDVDARTHARQKAAKLGANGIVFSPCISIEDDEDECLSARLCSAKAIKVLQNGNEEASND